MDWLVRQVASSESSKVNSFNSLHEFHTLYDEDTLIRLFTRPTRSILRLSYLALASNNRAGISYNRTLLSVGLAKKHVSINSPCRLPKFLPPSTLQKYHKNRKMRFKIANTKVVARSRRLQIQSKKPKSISLWGGGKNMFLS